jgi:tetratricopeptide (TPR) repeat protein
LRNVLRFPDRLGEPLRARTLLALANVHADQGDVFLSEMEAERAHHIAHDGSLDRVAAMALHTLGYVLSEQARFAEAIERFRQAARLYEGCGETYECLRVRVNVGACFVSLGKTREGIRFLREALAEAQAGGHRRLEAMAWCRLGRAYFDTGDLERARGSFRESNARASVGQEHYTDILFFNAYYEWQMALSDDNPTRTRLAFGRLKALRSSLERRMPEAEAFDQFVERGRADA